MQIEHIVNTTTSFLNGTHLEIVENKPENHVYIWIQAFENMHKSCVLGPDRYFLDLLYTISKFSVLSQQSSYALKIGCGTKLRWFEEDERTHDLAQAVKFKEPPTQSAFERRCYFQFSYVGG